MLAKNEVVCGTSNCKLKLGGQPIEQAQYCADNIRAGGKTPICHKTTGEIIGEAFAVPSTATFPGSDTPTATYTVKIDYELFEKDQL